MMISEPALLCLEATWRRLLRRPPDDDMLPISSATALRIDETSRTEPDTSEASGGAIMPATESSRQGVEPSPSGPLTADERRARAAALRALALSRGRQFGAARAAFTDAARLDPRLDLTRTPAFWTLERAAHEAAIDAYVDVGRDRDAAVLRARVRSTFRPRALRARPGPILST
ncbi:MAG: hypothetical protein ACRDJC_25945 [Thermomicrobiales bacterium]